MPFSWQKHNSNNTTDEMIFKKEPNLEVGIVSGIELTFNFNKPYYLVNQESVTTKHKEPEENINIFEEAIKIIPDKPEGVVQKLPDNPEDFVTSRFKESESFVQIFNNEYVVKYEGGFVIFQGEKFKRLEFKPLEMNGSCFELYNVSIGKDFHWERTEKQSFEGNLIIIIESNILTAINQVPLESYLTSVISSEMSAKASEELLKAHAVISRSWLLSQLQQKGKNKVKTQGFTENEKEHIKWYDREDHQNFDVCADDHCQRYQGITKASTHKVIKAIEATRGQVLFSDEEICDARFSKCCGGIMEEFQNCWEDSPKPYLLGIADRIGSLVKEKTVNHNDINYLNNAISDIESQKNITKNNFIPDLSDEKNAIEFISGSPEAFCNTKDKRILEQVLNNYDQETTDFFRWQVKYSKEDISNLIKKKSGLDFGTILELNPLLRGVSGRIIKLEVVGEKKTLIIGKELEIRKWLSPTHLYSSAFVVEKINDEFVLKGAGWGHGVGLCQIGAAVMGENGFGYNEILNHYYPNAELVNLYE